MVEVRVDDWRAYLRGEVFSLEMRDTTFKLHGCAASIPLVGPPLAIPFGV